MPVDNIARYEIVQELGKGAMGVVYKAIDPTIGRTLALKTMRLDVHGMEAEEMLQRFRNEARAAGLLNHPNIVTIYDAGEWEKLFYIAMEYIEGVSLHQRMRQGRLATEEVVDIIVQVCAGLDYAHGKGVIHRDVKPANIMLTGAVAKIMDFGIAKAGNATMTGTGQVLGTPNYMSPEQVRGKLLDGRSDLFGLGVILYELITGERPFTGENVTTIVYKIVHEKPIPPRELDVTIHPGLSAVVLKALEKTPDLRYQSGTELAKALRTYKTFGADQTGPTSVLDEQIQRAVSTGELPASVLTGSMAAGPGSSGASRASRTGAPFSGAISTAVATAPAMQESIQPPAAARPGAMPRPIPKGGKTSSHGGMIAAIAIVIFAFSAAAYWKYHKRPALRFPQQSTSATGSAVPGGETAAEAPAEQVEDLKSGEGAAGTGELSIDSKPQGALIALDGRHDVVWIAPYTFSNLKPGTHKITLQMDGYRTENRSLVIAAGKRVNDTFEMILNKGYLEVSTDPAGAALLLDGEATGQVTPGKLTLDPGPHRVAIRLDGYKAESAMVDVSAGQTLSISPKLTRSGPQGAQVPPAGPGKVTGDEPFDTPEQPGMNPLGRVRRFFAGVPAGKGVIEIRSRPRGADVWINRFQVPARTPLRIPIKPGTYVVTVHLPGFKPYSKTVEVKQGDVVPVETQLDKQP